MNKNITLLFLLLSFTAFCQQTLTIDKYVSVDMPYPINKEGSIEDGNIAYFTNKPDGTFLVRRELAEDKGINSYESSLPYNLESLENYYKNKAVEYTDSDQLQIESENVIDIQGFKGYQIIYKDTLKNTLSKVKYILLNKNFYSFLYQRAEYQNTSDANTFFNSINVTKGTGVSQFYGKSPQAKKSYNLGKKIGSFGAKNPLVSLGALVLVIIVLVLIIGTIVYATKKTKRY
ncbi:hypothetical protein [Aquimarina brevivitae]|uniref:Uncharacterized protein n=1 Tax=Aquimarina brevivitae TaxID=323412 RepID=A0A4V2F5M5_9FLAO|nr:hypothetical protein [Aquimarina brevivitae]RZS93339.1 hypothetical protein EV197_1917 [Aquimarina brevivitae]